MSIPEAIKQLRRELGITQEELGKICGTSPITVSRWENGVSIPGKKSAEQIMALADDSAASESCKEYLQRVFQISRRKVKGASASGFPALDMEVLNQVVDHGVDVIYIVDYETHVILYANIEAERVSGKSIYEADDRRCFRFFLNKNRPCDICMLNRGWTDKRIEDVLVSKAYGLKYRMRQKGILWQGRKYVVIYLQNITEVLKLEQDTKDMAET
ncbi:MAG: helix-turn-helix domain-containing protein [Clostridia bacterium]|nr:helix-turn-helix domain-containing protein [Clostridia bacterium]